MNNSKSPSLFLVSACLVGLCTRYDGKTKPDPDCITFLEKSTWIPVCPEQLGGLSTPRPAADIIDGDGRDVLQGRARVCTKDGADVTTSFTKGARQVLKIALLQDISGSASRPEVLPAPFPVQWASQPLSWPTTDILSTNSD